MVLRPRSDRPDGGWQPGPLLGHVRRLLPAVLAPWIWFLVRDLHPVMDVVALGLPVIVVVAVVVGLVVAAVRRRPPAVLVAGSWALFGLVAVVGPWLPHRWSEPDPSMRVVAANVYGSRPHPPTIATELERQRADVVVVSEVGTGLDEVWFDEWAGVVRSEPKGRSSTSDVAVLSRYPVTDLGLPPELEADRGVRVRVEGPAGPFVVYGMHLPPPRLDPGPDPDVSVREHTAIVRRLRDAVAAEELPVVLAGDLNLVDRASGYRKLVGVLDDAVRADWALPTSVRAATRLLLARVDHILMPSGWCAADASIFELTGSDHKGVAATVGPCP